MDRQEIHQKSVSPPKALVDSSPLQSAMERNRECEQFFLFIYLINHCFYTCMFHNPLITIALKIKLMVRRSANQLVEQGILPRKLIF